MLGIKNGFISLEFRTKEEVFADKYISEQAKVSLEENEMKELSTLTIDDERKDDTSTELQPFPQQQESDERLL